MQMFKEKLKKVIKLIDNKIFSYRLFLIEKKKMRDKRRVKLYSKVNLSNSEVKQIQQFFLNNYGNRIDIRWHKLYQSFTGKYNVDYFPEIIFSSKLEPLLCDRNIARQFTDKSMVELLYKNIDGLYIPKTIVLCCSGVYYDGDRNVLTREKALMLLNNCGKKIIKKTVDSCSGRGVLIIDVKNGIDEKNNQTVDELLKMFDGNFIVQELITNSNDIRKIYDKSLNTFRIITYIIDGKLYHVPVTMRMGKSGNEVDNIHAGGLFIGVNDDGTLLDTAFTEFQERYNFHPDSKLKFKGYKINHVKEIIDIAYKCHGRTPHLKLISWDFTINDKNQVTLIEVNLNGQSIWFPQMANGKSAFGENTKYFLQLLNKKRKG